MFRTSGTVVWDIHVAANLCPPSEGFIAMLLFKATVVTQNAYQCGHPIVTFNYLHPPQLSK